MRQMRISKSIKSSAFCCERGLLDHQKLGITGRIVYGILAVLEVATHAAIIWAFALWQDPVELSWDVLLSASLMDLLILSAFRAAMLLFFYTIVGLLSPLTMWLTFFPSAGYISAKVGYGFDLHPLPNILMLAASCGLTAIEAWTYCLHPETGWREYIRKPEFWDVVEQRGYGKSKAGDETKALLDTHGTDTDAFWLARGPRDATAIIFIPGALCTKAFVLMHIDEMSELFYCMGVDLPGHGGLADRRFSFSAAVDALADLIRTEVPAKKAFVVGHGGGGYIAMQLAVRHPELLHGIVCSNSSYSWHGSVTHCFSNAWSKIKSRFLPLNCWVRSRLRRKFVGKLAQEYINALSMPASINTETLPDWIDGLYSQDWLELCRKIQCDVMFINGEDDSLCREQEQQFAKACKRGHLEMIVGGEDAPITNSREYCDRIQAFTRKVAFVQDLRKTQAEREPRVETAREQLKQLDVRVESKSRVAPEPAVSAEAMHPIQRQMMLESGLSASPENNSSNSNRSPSKSTAGGSGQKPAKRPPPPARRSISTNEGHGHIQNTSGQPQAVISSATSSPASPSPAAISAAAAPSPPRPSVGQRFTAPRKDSASPAPTPAQPSPRHAETKPAEEVRVAVSAAAVVTPPVETPIKQTETAKPQAQAQSQPAVASPTNSDVSAKPAQSGSVKTPLLAQSGGQSSEDDHEIDNQNVDFHFNTSGSARPSPSQLGADHPQSRPAAVVAPVATQPAPSSPAKTVIPGEKPTKPMAIPARAESVTSKPPAAAAKPPVHPASKSSGSGKDATPTSPGTSHDDQKIDFHFGTPRDNSNVPTPTNASTVPATVAVPAAAVKPEVANVVKDTNAADSKAVDASPAKQPQSDTGAKAAPQQPVATPIAPAKQPAATVEPVAPKSPLLSVADDSQDDAAAAGANGDEVDDQSVGFHFATPQVPSTPVSSQPVAGTSPPKQSLLSPVSVSAAPASPSTTNGTGEADGKKAGSPVNQDAKATKDAAAAKPTTAALPVQPPADSAAPPEDDPDQDFVFHD